MKIKLLVAAAATVVASSAMAQSAFQGFYAQAGIGYENNKSGTPTINVAPSAGDPTSGTQGTQSTSSVNGGGFSSALGLGYTFSVAPQYLLTFGADYSPTSVTANGRISSDTSQGLQISNRYNIFLAPGYEIDKNKLAYFKAGYSSESVKIKGDIGDFLGTPSTNATGYILGLGYKQLIDKNIYVFGEGNYNKYGKTSYSGTTEGRAYTATVTPSAYQFLVGVGYKF